MTAVETRPGGRSGGPVLVGAHRDGPSGMPAERFTSTDPDAFEVPTGREEVWRFTPSRPLRSMFRSLEGAAMAPVEVEAPEGVEVSAVDHDHPLFGCALTPADRISGLAYAQVK